MLKYVPMFLTVLSAICAPAFSEEGTEPEAATTQEVATSEGTTEAENAAE